MSPAYQVEVVLVEEFGHNLGAECEGDTPIVLAPAHRVLHNQKQSNLVITYGAQTFCSPDEYLHTLDVSTPVMQGCGSGPFCRIRIRKFSTGSGSFPSYIKLYNAIICKLSCYKF